MLVCQDLTPEVVDEFRAEIAVLSALRHPNIVLFMGAVTVPPHYCLLTELVSRGSLWAVLHSDTPYVAIMTLLACHLIRPWRACMSARDIVQRGGVTLCAGSTGHSPSAWHLVSPREWRFCTHRARRSSTETSRWVLECHASRL
jgi:hypothetical protein